MYEALSKHTDARASIRGVAESYKGSQNVWEYYVKDATIRIDVGKPRMGAETYELQVKDVKITSVDRKIMKSAMER